MTKNHYLALDLGAESGRAILGTIQKDKLRLTETYRFPNGPIKLTDGIHWNIRRLWNEIQMGISASVKAAPLTSLAVDTWGVDFALLDKHDALLESPFHYRDSRTDGVPDIAFSRMARERIFAQTGIQVMQFNTLYQLLAMVQQKSPLLDAAQTFLTIPDLFNYWLSGVKCCEFTNATTTQCFDPLHRTWSYALLEALDIPTHFLPSVCEPGTNLGILLLPEIVDKSWDGNVQVIAPACHDTGSAVASVPAENEDFAWISSGTWSILGAEVKEPVLTNKALDYNFTNEGGVCGTWRLSKNITGLWLVQECKREWNLSYDELTNLAVQAKPFLAVIDVDDDSFLHPGNMPEKIQWFCSSSNQNVPQTQGEIIRVVLESLALKYRFVLDRLEDLTDKHFEPLHIIGGGTKNRLLNQFTANVTHRSVITGPIEATASGNILMQALSLGDLDSLKDARQVVRRSFVIEEYRSENHTDWDDSYAKLIALLGNQNHE